MGSFSGVTQARYQLEYDMNSKIIFVRTGKGEDEIRSKTTHLSGDIKRALLMVDGIAALGEISKRAAPSLRDGLDEMLKELEKGGFIQDKAKISNIPKMVAPPRMATSLKKPVNGGTSELDFTAAFRAPSPEVLAAEAAKAKAETDAKARALAEAKAKQDDEARARAEAEAKARALAEAKAKQEAEAVRIKAEAEAKARAEAEAKAREEAKRRAREEAEAVRLKALQEAEAARLKAEQEAAQARAELEAARAKAEAEEKARLEAEAAKLKAQQEAAKAHEEAERAKQQAAAEAKAREEVERRAKEEADAAVRLKAQQEAEAMLFQSAQDAAQAKALTEVVKSKSGVDLTARPTSATVLFFDVIGYTKQPANKQIEIKKQFNQLVSDCLGAQGDGERIILDTGDGAAIGFLQHPEDALEVAMQFRKTVLANQHKDYPELKVRIGIHLGPVNVVKDMNGQSNMVGDGINDAQRVMSFAGIDQIYISRSYYDFISRLSSEYADLFHYQGSQSDKHGREHLVYKLVDVVAPATEVVLPQASESDEVIKLEPFNFEIPGAAVPPAPAVAHKEPVAQQNDAASSVKKQSPSAMPPAAERAPETKQSKEAVKSDAEARKPSAEEVKKLEEAQGKIWAEAEQRAKEAAKASALQDVQPPPQPQPAAKKNAPIARVKRKPLPWFKLGAGLVVVALIVLFVAPYVMPTREYVPRIEQLLTSKLQQPVYIGRLAGRLLPTPRLDLIDVSIGESKQIKAQLARVNFALLKLFTETKSIDSVELEGVQVNGAALQQVSAWLQKAAADTEYPIARILLNEGKLEADGIRLSGVGGELSFNQAGKFSLAKLHAEGNKYALEMDATSGNKMQVSILVRSGALPLLPNWVFDDLSAKGELTSNELVITKLDSRIVGGILLGNARINWRSGWRAQGSLVAKTITMQNMLKVLSGDMDGTARFQMQAASLAKLTDAATLDGSFVIRKGVISGIDIVETARLRSTENLPGGRTHFDELSGELSYAKDAYAFRQLKMSAGVLTAKGTLDFSGQQVSGYISADLALREGMGPVALQLGGTRDNPTLRAVP